MRLLHRTLAAVALVTLAASASAQVHLNEIYFNDAGTDDLEFVELKGTPGLLLDGYLVLVVDGDGVSVHGTMKKAFDLSGKTIPASGYFVLGDTGVLPAPDLTIGTTNSIENGADTFYLIQTSSVSSITSLVGTHVDTPLGSPTTSLPGLGTIIDIIAVTDGASGAILYDGAQVLGPTTGMFPSAPNVYRCGDYPGAWDNVNFLALDPTIDPHPFATPSAVNENLCPGPVTPGTAYCFGDGFPSALTAACPCSNFGAAGNGCASSFNAGGANIAAHGTVAGDDVVLDGTGMNASGNCIFLKGDMDNVTGTVFGDGVRCTDGVLIRLRAKPLTAGAASFPDSVETVTLSQRGSTPVGSALTASYTVYYRNAATAFCPPATFNAANGYLITW